jgi:Tfp pilus assembly protein PilF
MGRHLEAGTVPAPGPDVFPHLARAALDTAVALRREHPAQAAELLQRGLRFDPGAVAVRLELTNLLGTLGRDAEAEAIATDGLGLATIAGEAAALHFNRANARARQGALDAASADLHACLALHPAFTEARAELVSVSISRGAWAEAEQHLAVLRAGGADPTLLAALSARLSQARGAS